MPLNGDSSENYGKDLSDFKDKYEDKLHNLNLQQTKMEGNLTQALENTSRIEKKLDGYIENADRKMEEFHKKQSDKLDKFIEAADRKYAPKLAWDILRWAGAVAGTSILVSLVGLVVTGGNN